MRYETDQRIDSFSENLRAGKTKFWNSKLISFAMRSNLKPKSPPGSASILAEFKRGRFDVRLPGTLGSGRFDSPMAGSKGNLGVSTSLVDDFVALDDGHH